MHAGVGLSYALSSLGESAPNAALRRASLEMGRGIDAGRSWSEQLKKYPGLFSPLVVAIIQAAEAGGFLDRAVLMLSKDAEREHAIYQTIKKETWYSKLLLFFALLFPIPIKIGTGALSVTVMPTHQILITMLLCALWVAVNYSWPLGTRGGNFRHWLDGVRLRLPFAGKTTRAFAAAKFCRFLGMAYSAGLSFPLGVTLAAQACGNVVLAERLQATTRHLEKGQTLASALIATGELPRNVVPLLHSGELSGDLDVQLQASARFLESDAEIALHQTVVTFCLIIFLLVAVKIGVMVIQFHLRIVNIGW